MSSARHCSQRDDRIDHGGTVAVVTSFRDGQIAALAASGWAQCRSVADAVSRAGLPPISVGYLQDAFTAGQWHAAERAVCGLRDF